ncbi:hypothetical protein CHISP_1186 [Chitinispirillum alkaliphilum]|nr:hypothetical protein CHISP_1186 [Chitinispirillum alkaliphilum]
MKKQKSVLSIVSALAILLLTSFAWSENNAFEEWDPHFDTGDMSYFAAIGFSPWWGRVGLALNPGVEYIVGEHRVGEAVPLSFGIAGIGSFVSDVNYGFSELGITVAGMGTAHLGFKNVGEPFEWLENFDVYIGLGLSLDLLQPGWYGHSRIRIASKQGTNYFIRDNFAVYIENAYLGRFRNYLTAGVLWKM